MVHKPVKGFSFASLCICISAPLDARRALERATFSAFMFLSSSCNKPASAFICSQSFAKHVRIGTCETPARERCKIRVECKQRHRQTIQATAVSSLHSIYFRVRSALFLFHTPDVKCPDTFKFLFQLSNSAESVTI